MTCLLRWLQGGRGLAVKRDALRTAMRAHHIEELAKIDGDLGASLQGCGERSPRWRLALAGFGDHQQAVVATDIQKIEELLNGDIGAANVEGNDEP